MISLSNKGRTRAYTLMFAVVEMGEDDVEELEEVEEAEDVDWVGAVVLMAGSRSMVAWQLK